MQPGKSAVTGAGMVRLGRGCAGGALLLLGLAACSQTQNVADSATTQSSQQPTEQSAPTDNQAKTSMTKAEGETAPTSETTLPAMPVATMQAQNAQVAMGESIAIEFQVENRGDNDVRLLLWGSPLEKSLSGPVFRVLYAAEGVSADSAMTEIPYAGRMIKRRAPADSDYVVLPAGEKLANTVTLDNAYALSQPGTYRIEFAPLSATQSDTFTLGDTTVYMLDRAVTIVRSR